MDNKSPKILEVEVGLNYPIFLYFLFCFMVQSSRAIDKE